MIEPKSKPKYGSKSMRKGAITVSRDDRTSREESPPQQTVATRLSPSHDMQRIHRPVAAEATQRPTAPRFVSLAEIARRWRVHRSTARRILDRGRVRPYALGGERGGTIRYDLAEILAFERKSREHSS